MEQVGDLLHGKEDAACAGSGYRAAQSRVKRGLQWHIARRLNDRVKMQEGRAKASARKQEYRKASIRAKMEHPYRVIERQFGLAKVKFKGWPRTQAYMNTLFALSISAGAILSSWGCGQKLGRPGGSSCIRAKTGFERSNTLS